MPPSAAWLRYWDNCTEEKSETLHRVIRPFKLDGACCARRWPRPIASRFRSLCWSLVFPTICTCRRWIRPSTDTPLPPSPQLGRGPCTLRCPSIPCQPLPLDHISTPDDKRLFRTARWGYRSRQRIRGVLTCPP